MTFWGAEISRASPFTLKRNVPLGRLHISQATLVCGFGSCNVECKVGNKSPILLCNLIPDVRENYHLELEFDELQDVVFSVVGIGIVSLSGYYVGGSGRDLAATAQETSGKLKKESKKKRDRDERGSDAEGGNVSEANLTDTKKKKKESKNNDKDLAPKVTKAGLNKHSFPDNVVIEVLAMGTPDGKIAIKKKTMVHVNYIIKIKNKTIYKSIVPGKRPYNFCLGTGQVIRGLDVGVRGMRVGEKRRLTIPPSYGWGNEQIGDKRVGLTIPPNSCLTFDVELVSVD